jgi:hypothetical protein
MGPDQILTWETFLDCVRDDYDQGLSDADVSKKYGGEVVNWKGRIIEKDSEYMFSGVSEWRCQRR